MCVGYIGLCVNKLILKLILFMDILLCLLNYELLCSNVHIYEYKNSK